MKTKDIFNTFNYIGVLLLAGIIIGFWIVDTIVINQYILSFFIFMILLAMYINYELNNPLEMDDDYDEDDDYYE